VAYGSRALPPGISNQASLSPCGMIVDAFEGDLKVASKPPLRSCSTMTGAMSVKNGGVAISSMLKWSLPLAQNPSEFLVYPFDCMIWAVLSRSKESIGYFWSRSATESQYGIKEPYLA